LTALPAKCLTAFGAARANLNACGAAWEKEVESINADKNVNNTGLKTLAYAQVKNSTEKRTAAKIVR